MKRLAVLFLLLLIPAVLFAGVCFELKDDGLLHQMDCPGDAAVPIPSWESIDPPEMDNPTSGYKEVTPGAIRDWSTGLVWQKETKSTRRNWDDAVAYCEDLSQGSFHDWRLPTHSEILTIADADFATHKGTHWTATEDASKRYSVIYTFGSRRTQTYKRQVRVYVKCVR